MYHESMECLPNDLRSSGDTQHCVITPLGLAAFYCSHGFQIHRNVVKQLEPRAMALACSELSPFAGEGGPILAWEGIHHNQLD